MTTRKQLVIAVLVLLVTVGVAFTAGTLLKQVQRDNQRAEEIRWAQTWAEVAKTLPPGTDLVQYMAARRMEPSEVEALHICQKN